MQEMALVVALLGHVHRSSASMVASGMHGHPKLTTHDMLGCRNTDIPLATGICVIEARLDPTSECLDFCRSHTPSFSALSWGPGGFARRELEKVTDAVSWETQRKNQSFPRDEALGRTRRGISKLEIN